MSKVYSQFYFEQIQIKSVDKARLFAKLLEEMEIEFWIRTTKINFKNIFICPEITEEELDTMNKTAMERHIRDIIRQLR